MHSRLFIQFETALRALAEVDFERLMSTAARW
jgi:hypothetical protein